MWESQTSVFECMAEGTGKQTLFCWDSSQKDNASKVVCPNKALEEQELT